MEGSKNALQLLNNARSRETAHRLDGLSLAKWNHVRDQGTVASDLRKQLTLLSERSGRPDPAYSSAADVIVAR